MGCTERVLVDGKIVQRDCHSGASASAELGDGPGTELKTLLKSWLGFDATLGCKCGAMARRMNQSGPAWCETAGMPEILAAMRGEHEKRRAKNQIVLPWSEFGARQLVLLACRRARAKASA